MTAEQQRLFHSPYLLQHQHGWRYNHLDAEMIQAILTALAERDPLWAEAALKSLVQNAALSRGNPVSLLDPYYDAEPLRRFFPEVIPTPDLTGWALYRAAWPVSRFCFVMAGPADVVLETSTRLVTPAPQNSPAQLEMNSRQIGEIPVGLGWSGQRIVVDGRYLRRGLNELAICWPFPVVEKEAKWQETIGRLEKGFDGHLHPVFGEIERLQIQIKGKPKLT
jgi:hypothetical protein